VQPQRFIIGKDASPESTIATLQAKLAALAFHVEERSWLNSIDGMSTGNTAPEARTQALSASAVG
jgi:ribosomal protein S12 methylthiotransferase accessory factor YcaO